ncbi:ROK family protein, partial [Streptomyces sp. SID3343]|uniref:ROK family protein n=1 Tax=Streptomyces sp. SID3343 TaxID=2690260 RepID=UPI001F3DDDED
MSTIVTAALDVGGTKIAAGLVGADGAVLHRDERPTATAGRLRDPELAGTRAAAVDLLATAARLGVTVTGLGAGFPEYVAADGHLTSREVLAWDKQPLDVLSEVAVDLPCAVGSDVRCGALGEARHGAGRGLDGFFYVSLGTGLSSTIVLAGSPVTGARGEAIALGEFEVPASVDPNWRGNLEGYASGRGIGDRFGVAGTREVLAAGGPRAAAVLDS